MHTFVISMKINAHKHTLRATADLSHKQPKCRLFTSRDWTQLLTFYQNLLNAAANFYKHWLASANLIKQSLKDIV